MRRSARTSRAKVAATLAVPLCLVGCAAAQAPSNSVSPPLRAENGSGIFDEQAAAEHRVTGLTITKPENLKLLSEHGVTVSGRITISSSEITAATVDARLADGPELTFSLTEAVVLRRAGDEDPVTVSGSLAIAGQTPVGTNVSVTPHLVGEGHDRLDLSIEIPKTLPPALQLMLGSTSSIDASVQLTTADEAQSANR